jgi:fructokinase
MMDKSRKFIVVGLGELLWDILPSGKKLGGAPANFAFHANSLGASSYIVSAVGEDILGDEIVERIEELNLDFKFIQRDSKHSTGTVDVKLDGSGIPNYIINTDVAWDNILFDDSMIQLAGSCNAVCFGSLAQRSAISRQTILKFLDQTSLECLKIFDVNLRQKFYSSKIIEESLQISNCLKLNENELPVIAEMLSIKGTENDIINYLLNTYKLKVVALTKGEKGSMLFTPSEKSTLVPESVEIIDTVGAGDAFTAGMSIGILNGLPLIEIHKLANRIATYVCTKAGATPELNEELINSIK